MDYTTAVTVGRLSDIRKLTSASQPFSKRQLLAGIRVAELIIMTLGATFLEATMATVLAAKGTIHLIISPFSSTMKPGLHFKTSYRHGDRAIRLALATILSIPGILAPKWPQKAFQHLKLDISEKGLLHRLASKVHSVITNKKAKALFSLSILALLYLEGNRSFVYTVHTVHTGIDIPTSIAVMGLSLVVYSFVFLKVLGWCDPIQPDHSSANHARGSSSIVSYVDPKAAAVALLGVGADYSRGDLTKAFRQKSLKGAYAHPDTGGSLEAYQKLTGAYGLLMQRRGWR